MRKKVILVPKQEDIRFLVKDSLLGLRISLERRQKILWFSFWSVEAYRFLRSIGYLKTVQAEMLADHYKNMVEEEKVDKFFVGR